MKAAIEYVSWMLFSCVFIVVYLAAWLVLSGRFWIGMGLGLLLMGGLS